MIIELSHYCLILALLLSAVNGLACFAPRFFQPLFFIRAQHILTGLILISFTGLIYAFVTSDFSVLLVMKHSHAAKPLLYKISAVWGNHEGSMLLWVLILSLWGSLYGVRAKEFENVSLTLAIQSMIIFGFLIFIVMTSNPFLRLPSPAETGMGFNPILQDISLALHPPLLYMGYVGFSLVFAITVAGLVKKNIHKAWAKHLRPWVLSAWGFLTLGITLGSLWAYYELGWGGFWFWDPVENASLLPWLAGTALLHSVVVLERRGCFKGWVAFLSILTFLMSLSGTFLVRSGLLTSVHSFATDPARGMFILGLLAVAVIGSLGLFALRGSQLSTSQNLRPLSREGMLLLNNIFLFSFLVTIFMGTFYPIFVTALGGSPLSVGAPYYQSIFIPLLIPFAFLMGVGPLVVWRSGHVEKILSKLAMPALITIFVLVMSIPLKPLLALGLGVTLWIVTTLIYDLYRKSAAFSRIKKMPLTYVGFFVAHMGFALFILGVSFATQTATEKTVWMTPAEHEILADYDVGFLTIEEDVGKNYSITRGVFHIRRDKEEFFLTPEKRFYPVADITTHETALYMDGLDIVYVVMAENDPKDPSRFVIRLYHHPLMALIFFGGVLIALGGFLSAFFLREKRSL